MSSPSHIDNKSVVSNDEWRIQSIIDDNDVDAKAFDNNAFSITTFNLFNYLEPPNAFYEFERIYSSKQWLQKQRWISEYLAQHQPDIIGFQEVFSADSLHLLVKEAGYPYFAVVDEPTIIDEFIYKDPVVAIASKFPITNVEAVKHDAQMASDMGLSPSFSFSRKALRATIDIPHVGFTDCYVVHFKSKRPSLSFEPTSATVEQVNFITQFTTEIAGSWASSIQRGSEAALLLISIIKRRDDNGFPMMLMGDFNNDLFDGVLSHLLTHSLRHGQPQNEDWLKKSSLFDAWQLYEAYKVLPQCNKGSTSIASDNKISHTTCLERTPTHYYGTKGNVLDYILLSCEFDAGYQGSFYEVQDYHVYDRHLINPSFERDGYSTDHAVVQVSLTLRE